MAPAARKTTGPSRPRTKGAASAVEDPTTTEPAVTAVETDQEATQAAADEAAPVTDVTPEEASPARRDMTVLARLADTSGRSAVTPYPGEEAPTPVVVPPPLRESHRWLREGDEPATARVLVDGWRVRINGVPRFAAKGDRVTAPADVISAAVGRGSLLREPEPEAPAQSEE